MPRFAEVARMPRKRIANLGRMGTMLLFVLAAPCWTPGAPHHGTGGYDIKKTITLTGIATSFDWANPHCLLHLDVKDDNGKVERWTLEMTGPNTLTRKGWRRDSIQPGDQVTVETHPAKNGLPLGISSGSSYVLRTVVNGKSLPVE